jgi:hypothetical protein
MTSSNKTPFLFPKWSNYLPTLVLIFLLGGLLITVFIFWYWFSPKHLNVGYQPEQPIPYSHRLHAGELGIDCRYCHTQVDKGAKASIPPVETCMNCHKIVKKDSPHIIKLREAYINNEPIEWVKVHHLADYSYFNHSRHVNSGISCVSCHGRIDQMEVVRQVEPLSMSWCLECHRNPEKHVRPKDKVADMYWHPSEDQEVLGKRLVELYHINPREDCSTCHR